MVSERVKQLRKTLKLTQADFGRKLGISKDVVANMEYARVKPRFVLLEHICSVFNVNMEWILEGTGEMFYEVLVDGSTWQEAMELFSNLSPSFQTYALNQVKELLHKQGNDDARDDYDDESDENTDF